MTKWALSSKVYSWVHRPFQVVLIDIKKAAYNKEIHCVKKPLLLDEDLNYVAISYRWGELSETVIDTKVGYLASVTSFDIQDFYQLCATMTKEPELASIDYVWVDAICVDQANYEQRKATIYHMTDIYDRAHFILAVPDLHAAHLIGTMTNHKDIMQHIRHHQTYIYHILHKNIDQLQACDTTFLDTIHVPRNPALRKLLTKYTDFFMDGLMTFRKYHHRFDSVKVLEHLYATSSLHADADGEKGDLSAEEEETEMQARIRKFVMNAEQNEMKKEIQSLHHCHEADCPLSINSCSKETMKRCRRQHQQQQDGKRNEWQRDIYQRSLEIRQSMQFLTDLIMDWSSRVWVISEFHISKKKNNLKFWFTQLSPQVASPHDRQALTFFSFDIHNNPLTSFQYVPAPSYSVVPDPVYFTFYKTLISQLNEQTFLEMMLKSKASKHVDRMFAIFPLFPRYNKQDGDGDHFANRSWHVNSLLSVKLALYQVMHTADAFELVYMSGMEDAPTLPTFATTSLHWNKEAAAAAAVLQDNTTTQDRNLFLDRNVTITLHKTKKNGNDGGLYYLHLKTRWYKTAGAAIIKPDVLQDGKKMDLLCHRLGINGPLGIVTDLVRIQDEEELTSNTRFIYLMGSFGKNKWILANESNFIKNHHLSWDKHLFYDGCDGFHIY